MPLNTRPPQVGHWSEPALRVLRERYLAREDGVVTETPEEMCWRVAGAIAAAEARFGRTPAAVGEVAAAFYDMMVGAYFLPNSPTLMNAGKDNQLQYSACYVLPVGDSMQEIFDSVTAAAMIHKCLVGDTFVVSDGITRLREVNDGAIVMTDEGPFHASGLHDTGEQPVFEVRSDRGYRVVGTREHRLLVVDDGGWYRWLTIGELRPGDWLVMRPGPWVGGRTKLPRFTFTQKPGRNRTSFKARECALPQELTPDLAELIGLYVGDGSNHRDGIRFTVGGDSPEVVQRIEDLSLALFGKKPSVSRYRGKEAFEAAILSTQLKAWFTFIGITKSSAREARIPEIILRSPEAEACAFVRGLFTADGCVRENGHITLTTISPRLSEELQLMLLALGMPTHRRTDVSRAGYTSYQVSICTKRGFQRFRERIGFSARKKTTRLAAVDDTKIFVRGEKIPNQRHRLRAWYDALPHEERRRAKIRFDDLLNRVRAPRELTRQRITRSIASSESYPSFFTELANEDYFFVRVTSVEGAGVRRVYDLTVPEKHAFLANGFVSHNSGGGTGFAFSRLRPKNDLVRSTGGRASGPVSFLRVFNAATEAVVQGGMRRGANMGVLRVDHPDILEFIECKLDGGITNFNISVAVTDAFMEALAKGTEYNLVNPRMGFVTGRLSAREVFDRIVRAAWRTGDPGMIFIDRVNRSPANPTPELGLIEATNPCGEQCLPPWDACNLGSINVARFARPADGDGMTLDWNELERVVRLAVRFLDDVIEVNPYPLPQIDAMVKSSRRIGLGVMGWADLLFTLGVPYDSQAALDLAERLMAFVKEKGHDQSARLAEERGPFPNWSRSIYRSGRPLRNCTVTTIAPTGTISMIAGCSSGIEPLFALAFEHRVKGPAEERVLGFVSESFERLSKARGFYSEALMAEVARRGSLLGIPGVPEEARGVFKTAHEIDYAWHVKHQAAFQKYTDNGVSKTINLPREATEDDVANAYVLAWELGCLGITVFRDGCKGSQVLNVGVRDEAAPTMQTVEQGVKPRPHSLAGTTYRMETPIGTAFITVNDTPSGDPFEVFVQVGKAGSDTMAVAEALGRLVSLVLRLPSPLSARRRLEEVSNQLSRIGGGQPTGFGTAKILSLPDALARTLAEHIGQSREEMEAAARADGPMPRRVGDLCKECGQATLIYEEGCKKCVACGFNEC